jgi:hypothetical protein
MLEAPSWGGRKVDVGLAPYGTVLVQWCVVHSHERRPTSATYVASERRLASREHDR